MDWYRRFPSPVSFVQVIRQAVSDWFGKEVQTGYTVTYIWMANQFGHFTLGFLFSFLAFWLVELFGGSLAHPWGWLLAVPVGLFLFWSAKEIYDYQQAVRGAPKVFPVDHLAIALDAATAVYFISYGLVVAYASLISPLAAVVAFFVLLLTTLIPGVYWLSQKLVFQRAGLPFLYRLADFPVPLAKADVERVLQLFNLRGPWKHLLITGAPGSGRTSFAVGIGSEHAFKLGKARYTTFFKFLALARQPQEPRIQDGQELWPWRSVNLVLIDDVAPELADDEPCLYRPKEAEKALLGLPAEALAALRSRRTVWVLGAPDQGAEWREALSRVLAVEPGELGLLALGAPIAPEAGRKAREGSVSALFK